MRYDEQTRWTGILKKNLWGKCNVIEEGCNGRTTERDDPFEEWKNGLGHLKACLNSHKPIDLVLLMLGTNDLKTVFHASAKEISLGAQKLVSQTKDFLLKKQGFAPHILLISPILIGEGIENGPFGYSFDASAFEQSKEFAALYQEVARRQECFYFDAASVAQPSMTDCLHMNPENHKALAEGLIPVICEILELS